MSKKAAVAERARTVARGRAKEKEEPTAKPAAKRGAKVAPAKAPAAKIPAGHRVVGTNAKTGKVLTKPVTEASVSRPESKKVQAAKAKLKIPKKLAQVGDLYYETRQERLDLDHQSDDKKAVETVLKNHLIDNLPKDAASGVAGRKARVALYEVDDFRVTDWDAFYKHVKKTGHFDLLNRALNQTAVAERIAQGKEVPGVSKFKITKVSINKL